ncbi:MAG: FtsW/RodA/SpoVE family cell cycle protein, partial [Anaerolineae bacterium]|nr:FtsW/RodA/SpoVE family cell cycle protein [Anaerolineae bacterium]
QGLGQGLPTAIPVVHTDFVFAAIGEEYGLLGALGVLLCFALLVSRAFAIGLRAHNGFEQLLAVGIGVMLGLQTLVITAGTLKLMPLTGVTLPFVSYGGSSLVTSFLMVGLLIFIAQGQAVPLPHLAQATDHPPAATRVTKYDLRPYLRLSRGLLFGFLVVAGGLIFWQILLAPFLLARSDNPRPVIEEQTNRRGRLLTSDGIPVAETVLNENGLAERRYPYAGLASVTGYYSIRYGVGGTEATFDPILRGTVGRDETEVWLDGLLHRPLTGQDITLTIDLPAQVAADVALDTREGAVVIMDLDTGAVLVMSSHPTYDPNTLDETWDSLREDTSAPLLNRATQGLFPVGDLARLIGLIGLYEARAQLPADPASAPVEEMLAPLGRSGYLATAHQLGLVQPLAGLRSQPGLLPDFDNKGTVRDLAVTPLHLARVAAAIERDGRLLSPILSLQQQPDQPKQVIRPETGQAVRGLFSQVDSRMIGLTGLATPIETGQSYLSWFIGLAPTSASPEGVGRPPPAGAMIFDPTKITPTPSPSPPASLAEADRARYVVVAVVVIADESDRNAAFRVARVSVQTILEQQTNQ